MSVERLDRSPTDHSVVEAARAGDRSAFSVLIAQERDLVYAYAYARLRSREEAEDVAQEAFVRAYRSLLELRRSEGWQPWLMRIVRNLCHDRLRRQRVRKSEVLDPEWLDGAPSPEAQFLAAERHRELTAAVASLPEKYRVPLLMRFGSGCGRKEIAVALGVPESTVVGRLAGAMRLLRQRLEEETLR